MKVYLATLPTVALHKLRIVKLLQIDSVNVCVLRGVPVSSNISNVLSLLDEKMLYLLTNKDNPNFDLILDDISFDMLAIADQYFDTSIDEIEDNYYTTIKDDYKINDNIIRYELKQLLNDIEIRHLEYKNKVSTLKLMLPDGVMFVTEE